MAKTAMMYMPPPIATPMPTVAQRPADVVRPLTVSFLVKITPAPRKPMAVTIPAAIREGSRFTFAPRTSSKPYLLTSIIRQEVRATMEWVRMPAVFRLFSLS